MPIKVWDEITYPFPNFSGCTVKVWEWIFNPTLYNGHNYLPILELMLNPVSKKGHWYESTANMFAKIPWSHTATTRPSAIIGSLVWWDAFLTAITLLARTNWPVSSWWLQMTWCRIGTRPGHQQPSRWLDCGYALPDYPSTDLPRVNTKET